MNIIEKKTEPRSKTEIKDEIKSLNEADKEDERTEKGLEEKITGLYKRLDDFKNMAKKLVAQEKETIPVVTKITPIPDTDEVAVQELKKRIEKQITEKQIKPEPGIEKITTIQKSEEKTSDAEKQQKINEILKKLQSNKEEKNKIEWERDGLIRKLISLEDKLKSYY